MYLEWEIVLSKWCVGDWFVTIWLPPLLVYGLNMIVCPRDFFYAFWIVLPSLFILDVSTYDLGTQRCNWQLQSFICFLTTYMNIVLQYFSFNNVNLNIKSRVHIHDNAQQINDFISSSYHPFSVSAPKSPHHGEKRSRSW